MSRGSSSVRIGELPADALLRKLARESGAYADCYVIDLPRLVAPAEFVEAFYTTWVFKLERLLIRLLMSKPSSDEEARRLAEGGLQAFAAWTVEARAPRQILLADLTGRTRSWLMAEPVRGSNGSAATRLYFGSALMPARPRAGRRLPARFVSRLVLGFHHLYSRILLRAARARLLRRA